VLDEPSALCAVVSAEGADEAPVSLDRSTQLQAAGDRREGAAAFTQCEDLCVDFPSRPSLPPQAASFGCGHRASLGRYRASRGRGRVRPPRHGSSRPECHVDRSSSRSSRELFALCSDQIPTLLEVLCQPSWPSGAPKRNGGVPAGDPPPCRAVIGARSRPEDPKGGDQVLEDDELRSNRANSGISRTGHAKNRATEPTYQLGGRHGRGWGSRARVVLTTTRLVDRRRSKPDGAACGIGGFCSEASFDRRARVGPRDRLPVRTADPRGGPHLCSPVSNSRRS